MRQSVGDGVEYAVAAIIRPITANSRMLRKIHKQKGQIKQQQKKRRRRRRKQAKKPLSTIEIPEEKAKLNQKRTLQKRTLQGNKTLNKILNTLLGQSD